MRRKNGIFVVFKTNEKERKKEGKRGGKGREKRGKEGKRARADGEELQQTALAGHEEEKPSKQQPTQHGT